jgi:hypothetical protein
MITHLSPKTFTHLFASPNTKVHFLITSPNQQLFNQESSFYPFLGLLVLHSFSFLRLASSWSSCVLTILFLFFLPSRGLLMRLSIFGRPAFLAAAYGGQYLIAESSGKVLSTSISKLQMTFVSAGYCLRQHSVDHQVGMEFVAVNPSILDELTTATM